MKYLILLPFLGFAICRLMYSVNASVQDTKTLHSYLMNGYILFISETKLDLSFRDQLFQVEGYWLERRDRNGYGGGIAAFVRTDIPARRRKDLEMTQTESIFYEVNINDSKWAFICVYRPPSQSNETFSQELFKSLDKCSTLYDNHLLFGDLNYDLLSESKSKPLTDIMELFDYKNLIKGATCFKKDCVPTLNDVILTNVSNKCMKSLNFCTGISDCHNFISTVINSNIARDEMTKFEYRSFKDFNQDQFLFDLQGIDFSYAQAADGDANAAYELFESQISQVVDKHAPLKQAYQRRKKLPCMNSTLKKAIFLKKKFFKEYEFNRNNKTWEKYRVQRNFVNKLKKKSINTYFKKGVLAAQSQIISGKPLNLTCLRKIQIQMLRSFYLKIPSWLQIKRK